MKTIFRFLSTGVMTAALLAVAATAGFGQGTPAATPNASCADIDGHNALYAKFTGIYLKKTSSDMRTALSTGKEYLEKFGSCEAFKEQVDFVRPHVERIEKKLPDMVKAEELGPIFKRFDAGINADNADEIYAAGREILAKDPDNINIIVPLGVVGLYQSYNNNNMKFADDTIRYAQMALSKIKAGTPATKKNKAGADVYGALKYELTKDLALDELGYSVAHLTFYGKKDKKAALPLYYEISQRSGRYKDDPRVYQTIGSHFGSEVLRLNAEVAKLIVAQKALPTEDEKLKMEPQIKETIGLINGNAERALDYYSRAYKLAKSDTPAAKTYKDGLYKDLTVLYEGRFSKKDGLDAYIATVVTKPMPNPTTPVTPISDPEPTPTTTTGTATKPATTPATKPASAPATEPTTTATKPATKPMSTTVTTKSTTVTAKPVAATKPTVSKKAPRK